MPSISKPELLSESSLSKDVLMSSEQPLLSSQDNISYGTICHNDDVQIDDDGSKEVSSLINDGLLHLYPKQGAVVLLVDQQ